MQRDTELTVADNRYPNKIYKTTKSVYFNWFPDALYNNIPFNVGGELIPRDNLLLRSDINNKWYSWDTSLPSMEHGTNFTLKGPVASGYYPTGGRKRSRRRKQKKSRRRKQKKSRRNH
jgi:hypothetical protein